MKGANRRPIILASIAIAMILAVVFAINILARSSGHTSRFQAALIELFGSHSSDYKASDEGARVLLTGAKQITVESRRSDIRVELVSEADASEMGVAGTSAEAKGNFGFLQIQGDLPVVPSGKHLTVTRNGDEVNLNVFDAGKDDLLDVISNDHEVAQLTLKVPASFAGNLKIRSVVGDVSIEDLKLESMQVETVSGDLEIGAVKTSRLIFKSVSGSATGVVSLSYLTCETTSGDIDLDLPESQGGKFVSGTIANVSGATVLRLPTTANMTVEAKSVSGTVESEWAELVVQESPGARQAQGKLGTGEAQLTVKSVSGEISLGKTL